jgi:hypothetical protein
VAAGHFEALSNSSILFADGVEAGVAVGLWPPHASNTAADAKITANRFLEVVFMSSDPPLPICSDLLLLVMKSSGESAQK